MKKILLLIFVLQNFSGYSQNVSIKGKQFFDPSNNAFFPIICNYNGFITLDEGSTSSYHFTNHPYYGETGFCECSTQVSCDAVLLADFEHMISMGFNAVRLAGVYPKFYNQPQGGPGLGVPANVNNQCYWVEGKLPIPYPCAGSSSADLLINSYKKALEIAAQCSKPFYVIPLTWGQDLENTNFDANVRAAYLDFLSYLAQSLTGYPYLDRLLAIDLFNEPCYHFRDPINKQAVCSMVSEWHDAIKSYLPNALITIGNCWDDIYNFDAAVMKLDFIMPHFYPQTIVHNQYIGAANSQHQIKAAMRWMNETYKMPWVVGETGFKAAGNYSPLDGMDGSTAEQAAYGLFSLDMARHCGASGYGWWSFQDLHSAEPPPKFGLAFYGLLERDISCDPCTPVEKPVVDVFRNYAYPEVDEAQCFLDPPAYYDPLGNAALNASGLNAVTGRVTDETTGEGIENALVGGSSWTRTITDGNGNILDEEGYFAYTFSDIDGNYTLVPYNYFDPVDHRLPFIKASAAGAERETAGNYYSADYLPDGLSTINFQLRRNMPAENVSLSGISYPPTATVNRESNNSIELSNVYLFSQSGSGTQMNLVARNEIKVSNTFQAPLGSYVHWSNAPVVSDCMDFDQYLRKRNLTTDIETKNEVDVNELDLRFFVAGKFDFILMPNPAHTFINLKLINSVAIKSTCFVRSAMGAALLQTEITGNEHLLNIDGLPSGVYFITLVQNQNSITKKFIIL